MDFIQLIIIAVISFLVAGLSAVAQGGGTYVIIPMLLSFGVQPATVIASLNISNMGFVVGSIAGLKGIKVKDWLTVVYMTIIGIVTGFFVPIILTKINADFYSIVIAVLLIIFTPILYFKPFGLNPSRPTTKSKIIGYFLLLINMIIARIAIGVGALFSFVLCKYFGMTVLQASLARKYSGLVSGVFVAVWVSVAGFVNWQLAAVLTISALSGSFVGSKILVGKGNEWAAKVMVIAMLVSGVILIINVINK